MSQSERYKPIEDYALVGDCHGCALVARNGDIDWCTLGRFDATPILFPILDADQGGTWLIRMVGATHHERAYEDASNVLRSVQRGPDGAIEIIDFMPVGRRSDAGPYDYVTLAAPGWMVRLVRAIEGSPSIIMRMLPAKPDWARKEGSLEVRGRSAMLGGNAASERSNTLYATHDLGRDGDAVVCETQLQEGERASFVLAAAPAHDDPCDRADEYLAQTRAFWTEWAQFCRYGGPHERQVQRSALALKLLTYAPTGAMVAAATTSLPEDIGGVRNWDYRYCWVRDSALSLYAFAAVGYSGEGHDFSRFLMGQPLPRFTPLKIMYTVQGERQLEEEDLHHLEGYRGSKPVRVGNGAHDQVQLDVYGEILDLAEVRARLGVELNPRERTLLADVADEVARVWREPDAGLWEARSAPRHYSHSKMMAWVALDRAIRLLGPRPRWIEARDAVYRALVEGTEGGHIPRVLPFDGDPGGEGMDAALLLAPVHGLDLPPEIMDATVRAVEAELRDDLFVHRYRGGDGLPGEEGAFLICSFWLVDALIATDRVDEARAMFERLCALSNDVGLFAEEADPETGAHLGNFPQAFTHLALIGSAVNLKLYDEGGAEAVRGSYADRVERASVATEGWRGILETWKQTGRPVRIRGSKESVLVV